MGMDNNSRFKYNYNICTEADKDLFKKQCQALEKYIPNLIKKHHLIDVDGSLIEVYAKDEKGIVVHNSEFIGALYIESEIDIEPYFEEYNRNRLNKKS